MRKWWSRTRGIEPAAYETWRSTLAEVPGRQPQVLTWTSNADGGLVVLSPSVLSVRGDDGWRHVGWHEIERGGWNSETRQLHWQTYDGRRGVVVLAEPARLPAVFKERVDASVVFERFVPQSAGSDRGVIVNGRRDLADGQSPIEWRTTLSRGVTWRTPGIRELADAALAELRDEYDRS